MTHDELLSHIDDLAVYDSGYVAISESLRAVVKLHKPDFRGECMAMECECNCQGKMGVPYPCPTIRSIERQLK